MLIFNEKTPPTQNKPKKPKRKPKTKTKQQKQNQKQQQQQQSEHFDICFSLDVTETFFNFILMTVATRLDTASLA